MKLIEFKHRYLSVPTGINQITMRRLLTFLLITFAFNGFVQASNNIQSLKEIRDTAKKFLEEKQTSADNREIEITIGKIDSRMRLAKCDAGLEAFFPQHARTQGKTTVGIRCLGTVAWKIFVSVEIAEYQTVWVAQRHISTAETISASDVERKKVKLSLLRKSPIEDLSAIVNTSPIRSIRAGAVLLEGNICLVCKGAKVKVTTQNQFMSILVDGIAMGNATLGETAQVKNSKSKRTFGAVVTGKNKLIVMR